MAAGRKLLFDSADLAVEFVPAQSDTLVVSFSSFSGEKGRHSRFGYPFLGNKGFAAVYVVAKLNHWWQTPDMDEAAHHIRRVARRYRRVVTYGSSMGGFGALLMADAVGATHVLAVSPQTVLSDPRVPLKAQWQTFISQRPIIRDGVRDRLPERCTVTVLYDPSARRDRSHVQHIADLPGVTGFAAPFGSHKILRVLQEMGIVSDVTVRLINGNLDSGEFRRLFRDGRRRSPSYLTYLALQCAKRGHPQFAARVSALLSSSS